MVILCSYRVFTKYCVFSKDFKIFRTLTFLCVYTHQAGRKPELKQNWQSSEKSQSFKEKTQYLMNTLYLHSFFLNIFQGYLCNQQFCAFRSYYFFSFHPFIPLFVLFVSMSYFLSHSPPSCPFKNSSKSRRQAFYNINQEKSFEQGSIYENAQQISVNVYECYDRYLPNYFSQVIPIFQ